MDVEIRSYPDTSFYVGEAGKRWVYGNFCIYCNRVTFCEKTVGRPKRKTLFFNEVMSIHELIATFFFIAIVMTLKSGETFWFSSFQDRESVFRLLCHFHQNFRTNNQDISQHRSNSQRTEIGTKLLGIATGSLSTLSNAAVTLSHQSLESWFRQWNLPEIFKKVDPVTVTDYGIPQAHIFDFEVLYTKIEMDKTGQQLEGIIQISKTGLNILNLKQKVMFHFDWSNVSKIRVISPWEMVVIQYQIGKPDITYAFVSSLLINILHKVQPFCGNKIDYETSKLSPLDVQPTNLVSQTQPSLLNRRLGQKLVRPDLDNDETIFGSLSTKASFGRVSQVSVGPKSSERSTSRKQMIQKHVLKEKPVITNVEVDELSSTLRDLKSVMLDVGEKLDRVTESVDEANIKLVSVNKRINKLM